MEKKQNQESIKGKSASYSKDNRVTKALDQDKSKSSATKNDDKNEKSSSTFAKPKTKK